MKNTLFLLLISSSLFAQELIQNDYEKGYVKDGKKISVWQYFDEKKEIELSINYSTGKIIFVSKDPSKYVIFKDGEWVTSMLDVHPVPLVGYHNFYQRFFNKLNYPKKAYINKLEGKVVASFDVDTLGNSTNFQIIKSISGGCDSAVLASLKEVDMKWISAIVGKKKYTAKFAIEVEFRLIRNEAPLEHKDFKIDPLRYKFLHDFVVDTYYIPESSGKRAEFPGGMNALFDYINKNKLQVAYAAKKIGMTGQVSVKFIIEVDGSTSSPEIITPVNSSSDDHDRKIKIQIYDEIKRIILKMPEWRPGEKDGKKIRSYFTLPIKLD